MDHVMCHGKQIRPLNAKLGYNALTHRIRWERRIKDEAHTSDWHGNVPREIKWRETHLCTMLKKGGGGVVVRFKNLEQLLDAIVSVPNADLNLFRRKALGT
jgi:hypothetical protein